MNIIQKRHFFLRLELPKKFLIEKNMSQILTFKRMKKISSQLRDFSKSGKKKIFLLFENELKFMSFQKE